MQLHHDYFCICPKEFRGKNCEGNMKKLPLKLLEIRRKFLITQTLTMIIEVKCCKKFKKLLKNLSLFARELKNLLKNKTSNAAVCIPITRMRL